MGYQHLLGPFNFSCRSILKIQFDLSVLVNSNFSNNALSTLPSEMGELSRLGTLDLQSNQVTRSSFCICSIHTVNLFGKRGETNLSCILA